MALGDITIFNDGQFGTPGSKRFVVASGTAASINAGEPVGKALAAVAVATLATNKPVVGTDFIAGISATTSTETAAANGVVDVIPVTPGATFLITPNVVATWNTQAKYDALVGSRVLIDKTSGIYTILAADGSTNGCVVEPLNIIRYPNKVRFSLRQALNYFA